MLEALLTTPVWFSLILPFKCFRGFRKRATNLLSLTNTLGLESAITHRVPSNALTCIFYQADIHYTNGQGAHLPKIHLSNHRWLRHAGLPLDVVIASKSLDHQVENRISPVYHAESSLHAGIWPPDLVPHRPMRRRKGWTTQPIALPGIAHVFLLQPHLEIAGHLAIQ